MKQPGSPIVPEAITQKLALGAQRNEKAIVVGRSDGIIEWANAAWTDVTGYPLHESLGKPVLSFLENVDVEAGVVDFVATCFKQGRLCEVEIPVTTPKGDSLWIHLRVEPVFEDSADGAGARGPEEEPTDFIATATDVTQRKLAENPPVREVDLGEIARAAVDQHGWVIGSLTAFDLCLPEDLPPVLGDPSLLEGLVSRALCRGAHAIGEGWGTITLWAGILGYDRGPCFQGDLWRDLPEGLFAFLEVHDTGGMPGGGPSLPPGEPFLSLQHADDVISFSEACGRIQAFGGALRVETATGTGTSVVLLLPFCSG